MRRFWLDEEDLFLKVHYPVEGLKYCQDSLDRSRDSIKCRARKLGIKGTKTVKKSQEVYESELPKDIKLIGLYINNNTATEHIHLKCGNTWSTRPRTILSGTGCPHCSKTGYTTEEAYLYFIYLAEFDLYKLGITKNLSIRLKSFSTSIQLIVSKKFSKGIDARKIEQSLLKDYKDSLYNSGELNSGNTETFIFDKSQVTEIVELIVSY